MSICFNCGKILRNINVPCPNCGYFYSADTNKECPNIRMGTCLVTKALCRNMGNYGKCPVKNELEREEDS